MPRKSSPRKQRDYADRLWSKLIRARGVCARCGKVGPTEAAHIVRRRYSWTRTDLSNGWELCHSCHALVDRDASVFMDWVEQTIGVDALRALEQQAQRRDKFDWYAEYERLKAIAKERVSSLEAT